MRQVLFSVLVALMVVPLIATAAPKKLKMGVTIEKYDDVFMRYCLDQLSDEATKNNIDVLAADGKGDASEQIAEVENFITQGVDAILIHVVDQTVAPQVTKLCLAANIPVVYFNRRPPDAQLVDGKAVAIGFNRIEQTEDHWITSHPPSKKHPFTGHPQGIVIKYAPCSQAPA